MKVSMDEFKSLAARYGDLHQSSFDADYATLRNVELYPYHQPPDAGGISHTDRVTHHTSLYG
jgi:hypothetical protein